MPYVGDSVVPMPGPAFTPPQQPESFHSITIEAQPSSPVPERAILNTPVAGTATVWGAAKVHCREVGESVSCTPST